MNAYNYLTGGTALYSNAPKQAYTGKAVEMVIDVLAAQGGFELRRHTNSNSGKVQYKLLWDGECVSTCYDEKEARELFSDFCPTPKKPRGRPKKQAA